MLQMEWNPRVGEEWNYFLDRSDSIQGLTPAEQLEKDLVFFLVRGEC